MDLASLDRRQLEELYEGLAQLSGSEPLASFIPRVSPHHPPPSHVEPLIRAIEGARYRPLRLCVHMPPRHAKTVTLLHSIAWWVQNWPADMNAYIGYNDTIALSKSRLCRGLVGIAGIALGGYSEAAGEWLTRTGGGLVAAGAGAGLTGRGFHGLVVVDDPYKNREEADSRARKEAIWENFNEVVMTRLEGASVIVCHTRWCQDDLIGRLTEEKGWAYLNLPAIADASDTLGRKPGAALWPDRFDEQKLDEIRRQIGEWSFAALYQGQPRPRGHTVFGPEHYHEDNTLDGHRLIIYADPAASAKTTADYGVMMCMALKGSGADQSAKILDLERGQMTVPDFARALLAFQHRNDGAPVLVESVGGFKAVPQILREIEPDLAIEEDIPRGDKFQRAQAVAAAWNDGRVTVPRRAPWVKEFLEEVRSFTGVNDAHDDQVDCLSGCWNHGIIDDDPFRYY